MKMKLPIRVGLMDDDCFALKWIADLLTRDLRTHVTFETSSPKRLLSAVEHCPEIDAVILDPEYAACEMDLGNLICRLQSSYANPLILFLSQYGQPEAFQLALTRGARGFLLKQEVQMGIVSALLLAAQTDFLVSPGLLPLLHQEYWRISPQVARINPWSPHPGLTSQLRQVFTMRVLYGMSAPMVANEIHLAPSSVEKYMQVAYQVLATQWGDESFLLGINLQGYSQEVQAFHRFILPPIVNLSG